MGQHNRARRAAKQRQRAQQQRGRSTAWERATEDAVWARAAALLLDAAVRQLARGGTESPALLEFVLCAERHQQAAIDEHYAAAVDAVVAAGWTPLDLDEVVRRRTASTAVGHLLDVVAGVTAEHPARLVHPQWQAQLTQLGATVRQAGGGSPAGGWAARAGLAWADAVEHLVAVLVVLCALPALPRVLPPPGRAADHAEAGVDATVLRRVRALLAKAESTEHSEEADALTAKAQQLMTRYSLDRAVAESCAPGAPEPACRRLWLPSPYVDAKALLVDVVAQANNCQAVQSTLGYVAVVGHPAELDVVELLVTSLLVQATRAMSLAGRHTTRHGTSRTRSFRQSFLVAYAGRIGERLRATAHEAETSHADGGGALVPVLTARRERVEQEVAALFPSLVERRIAVSNAAGYGAGRAAADLALFDVRDALAPRAG